MNNSLRNLRILRTDISTPEICLIEVNLLSDCGDDSCEGTMKKKEVFEVDDMTVIVLECNECGYCGTIHLNLY